MTRSILIFSSICALVISFVAPLFTVSAATPPGVYLAHIQAGGKSSALQELVVIINKTGGDVDITDWCLTNKSQQEFVCFKGPKESESIMISNHGYAIAVSTMYADAIYGNYSATYTPSRQSSGSITGGGDTITLLNAQKQVVDSYQWTTPLNGGQWVSRQVDSGEIKLDRDWLVRDYPTPAYASTFFQPRQVVDMCPNIQGVQYSVPTEMMRQGDECRYMTMPLRVTEILPNAQGVDDGNEYIELYNPNFLPVELSHYSLKLGVKDEKTVALPSRTIEPQSYAIVRNNEVDFILTNTEGKVQVVDRNGDVSDESATYAEAPDDQPWIFYEGTWQYSTTQTPGAANVFTSTIATELAKEAAVSTYSATTKTPTPCASNQERNPVTGRCRQVATTSPQIACRSDQIRNPETGRCKLVAASSQPMPCAEGQVRNEETGRCRKVQAMTSVAHAPETKEENKADHTALYIWASAGVLIAAALSYGIWEWREELRRFGRKFLGPRRQPK